MATPVKVDPKPMCKYGANCYRKSEAHQKQYRHPKRTNEDDSDRKDEPKKRKVETPKAGKTPKAQGTTITDYFGKKKNDETESSQSPDKAKDKETSTSSSKEEEDQKKGSLSDEDADSGEEEDEETEAPESPADVRENIKSKFLVEMPEDFYDFWKFCERLNKEDPLDALQDTLGFTLVGPYDVLAGRHKDVARNSAGRRPNFLLHWRYYYDPPEFLTVIKGDDETQFHIGFFRDDPSEMPAFVAANCAKENGLITPRGENLFAAISYYAGEKLKDKKLAGDKKKSLQKLQDLLKTAATEGKYSLELKTKGMKERDKKSVCKTLHGAGMVVPVDDNEVGYRPVPETPADLKKILVRIRDSKTEEERDKNLDPLQEIITLVQFANDECDYGEGLELGLDLFTFGGKCFHSPIGSLLTLAYQLLRRPEYSKIIEAHLKRRSHSASLSQID